MARRTCVRSVSAVSKRRSPEHQTCCRENHHVTAGRYWSFHWAHFIPTLN